MSKPTAKNVTELYRAARQLLLNTERTPFLEKSLDRVRDALEPFEKSRRGLPRTRVLNTARGEKGP